MPFSLPGAPVRRPLSRRNDRAHRPVRSMLVALSAVAVIATTTGLAAPASAEIVAPRGDVPVTASGAPQTIPALARWTAATGALVVDDSLQVGADEGSTAAAEMLTERLSERLGREVGATDAPAAGDVTLTRDESRLAELGDEGYELVVDDGLRITAATERGVFWGSQTLIQILSQGDRIPRGSSIDVPQYAERGVGICACQITADVDWILRLIEDMSYVKLNQLWLETKVASEGYPKANFWGYFTPEQAKSISDAAKSNNITVVPEVNSPGHMAPWLRNYPDLQLVDNQGKRDADRLDISQPAAYDMITTLIDEYFAVFDTPYWHMGGDEYMLGSAYANYPQFQKFIDENPSIFPAGSTPTDVVTHFMNRINEYVKSKGKTLRIWNDGQLTGTKLRLDEDIVVEHWQGGDNLVTPQQLIDQGHAVQNSAYSLYLIRSNGADPYRPEKLWNEGWTPRSFEDGSNVVDNAASGGYVTGAKITTWPDYAKERTENQVEASLLAGTRFIAQATWGSDKPVESYSDFAALTDRTGRVPGYENVDRAPLAEGDYAIRTGAVTFAGGAPDERLTAAGTGPLYRFSPTDDDYYTIRSTQDQCLTVRDGTLTLGAPLDQGLAPVFTTCSSEDNFQKWQMRSTQGGFTIANAIALAPLVVQDGVLVQQAPDVQAPAVFTLTGAVAATIAVDGSVSRGSSVTATVTVANQTDSGIFDAKVALALPQGWGAPEGDTRTVGSVDSRGTSTARFPLQVSDRAVVSATKLTADVTYRDAEGVERTVTAATTLDVSCSAAEVSPRALVRVDSAETTFENTPGSNAIDGNPSTFWGTAWSGSNPTYPHEITVDLGEGASTCGVFYLPRQGNSNGAVSSYEIYVRDDAASPTGTPTVKGTLPATSGKSRIAFPEPVAGRYLTLRALGESGPVTTNTTAVAELTVDPFAGETGSVSPKLVLGSSSGRPGDRVALEISGGAAFWRYGIAFGDGSVSVADVRTDRDGAAKATITVPEGEALGEQKVVLLDGKTVVASATFTVTAGAQTPPTTGPSTGPSGKTNTGTLASTGFDLPGVAGLSALLLALGATAHLLVRRSRVRGAKS